jgi:hypothetical protein
MPNACAMILVFVQKDYAAKTILLPGKVVDVRLQSEDSNSGGEDKATEAGSHVGGRAGGGLDLGEVATGGLGDASGERDRRGVDSSGVVGDSVGSSSGGGGSGDRGGAGDHLGHGRVDGSDNRGSRLDGRADGGRGVRRGSGVGGGSSGVGRRSSSLLVVVGDAELGGVLVLASLVVDELDAVALGALRGLEGALGVPGVAAAVLDLLGDGVDGNEVLGRALEEDQGDGARGGRLPGDGEALADRDDGVQARLRDGVALGSIASGSGVGRDQRSKGGEASGEKTEHGGRHFERLFVGLKVVD